MAKTQHGRDLSGEEMAQMLDEFANGCDSKRVAEFVEQLTCRTHRTLQQKIAALMVAAFEAWAEDKGGHDGRNEATFKLAKKFIAATGDKYDRHLPLI